MLHITLKYNLTWSTAFKVRITCVAWSACTNASVISSFTISISSTVTGIYTLFISTRKSGWTLRICQAFIGSTFNIRTTLVSRWTLTFGPMYTDSAESFDSTLLIWAGVLAFSLDASLSERTFIITLATSYKKITRKTGQKSFAYS